MGASNSTNLTRSQEEILKHFSPELISEYLKYMESVTYTDYNDEIYYGIRLTFSVILTLIVSGFGTVTNIINLVVFVRQGILSDSCTPSLTALAVSDLCVNVITFAEAVVHALDQGLTEIDKLMGRRMYLSDNITISVIISKPYPMFCQITCVITAYLAFERMVSVSFPFQVRNFFTPKRSLIINGIFFCVMFIMYFPKNSENILMQNEPWGLDLESTDFFSDDFIKLSELTNNVLLRFTTIAMVIVFNGIVAYRVYASTQFRKSTTRPDKDINTAKTKTMISKTKNRATKEIKLIQMMSVLCVTLVVSYLPTICFQCFQFTVENGMDYTFFAHGMEIVSRFLLTVNSSCNILVYYTMSTKYRLELNRMCLCSWL